jgi:dCMP deaminase
MDQMGNKKRPDWDEYFMTVALAAASRASCLKIHSGAVIVKNKRILSMGYNGFPSGMKSCFERGECRKDSLGIKWDQKNTGHCFTVHAEVNSLLQVAGRDMRGATLYSVLYPCADCAKNIAGAGIKEVVYLRNYKEKESQTGEIFKQAGIKLRKINYNVIEILDLIKFIAEDKFA